MDRRKDGRIFERMKAAIVESFEQPPAYGDFSEPEAGPGESVIAVRAAPLSPIVKALASGKHYTRAAGAGFVPGVDGVGLDPSGKRVYFLFPRSPFGSMAERTVVTTELTVPVPDALSDAEAAALPTAGLASWVALTRRAPIRRGDVVLVVGATGAAGSMALQVARHLGASRTIAVGRDRAKLDALDADVRIALDADADGALRGEVARGVDIVLDFLWGEPAARVLRAATHRSGSPTGERRIRYVQLGTVAGAEIAVRGDTFRSTGLELLGSGIGSVAVRDLITGAGELLAAASVAKLRAPHRIMALPDVSAAWSADSDLRLVMTVT